MKAIRPPKAVKLGCLVPLAGIVALVLPLILLDAVVPSSARRALPSSASEIQEYYDDSWNGDFVRLVKAPLPATDYAEYARRLGLSARFDPTLHHDIASYVNMGIVDAAWWDPSGATTNTYFDYKKGDDYLQVLSYKDGYVYFKTVSWQRGRTRRST